MKHAKRLAELEIASRPATGFRFYATNDELETAGYFIDCNAEPFGYRASLAPAGDHVRSVDDLDDEQRAKVVGRERIAEDERAGHRVFITKYTRHWRGTPDNV